MSSETRLRRFALILGVFAVVLGGVSLVALFWVISETDTGILCDPGFAYEREEPWSNPGACVFYDVPFWTLGFAAVCAIGALLTLVAALLQPTPPSDP